ncbi:MAG TPA: response regulator transcription factor [Acidimicrobiales bacterium]|nr:response regulator transcription factor [Acidimicrobiales bacterium]
MADDNAGVRKLTRLALSFTGRYEVVGEAADGAEAVALAETLQPDVVVLDLLMPGTSGWDALPMIRDRLPRTKVVIWSAGVVPAVDEDRLIGLGAAAVVTKDRPPQALRAAIDSVLDEE